MAAEHGWKVSADIKPSLLLFIHMDQLKSGPRAAEIHRRFYHYFPRVIISKPSFYPKDTPSDTKYIK